MREGGRAGAATKAAGSAVTHGTWAAGGRIVKVDFCSAGAESSMQGSPIHADHDGMRRFSIFTIPSHSPSRAGRRRRAGRPPWERPGPYFHYLSQWGTSLSPSLALDALFAAVLGDAADGCGHRSARAVRLQGADDG